MTGPSTLQEAMHAAGDARRAAHAPYSGFMVGAAVIDRNGRVHSGCNVENSSFGLTICAERVAVAKAVSEGIRVFSALVVVSAGAKSPCGACRQVMAEFAGDDLQVILVDADRPDKVVETSLGVLLPARFHLGSS